MGQCKKLTKPRFEALLYRREPYVQFLFEELEWWTSANESVIAVLTHHRFDGDFGYAVLGRDETGVFRGVAVDVLFDDAQNARAAMLAKIEELTVGGQQEFPQEDNDRKKNELLVPCVSEEKLHPSFKVLMNEERYSPARELIRELAFAFKDRDGNFRKDFQTQGFDSRLWELYLYAVFYEQRFAINDVHAVPDFIIANPQGEVAVEAVTVNPTANLQAPVPMSREEEFELSRDYMPIKWGSALFSKLNKEYWKQSHIQGMPLVFAIHDFHARGSMIWTIHALIDCLYGVRGGEDGRDHPIDFYNWGTKKNIPAGFFRQPKSEHVSAVIASNEATLTKFNRIGKIAGFGSPNVVIRRMGAMHDLVTGTVEPFETNTEVGIADETWSHGLKVLHNPNATQPLPHDFFPDALNIYLDSEGQRNYLSTRRHHVVRSASFINLKNDAH